MAKDRFVVGRDPRRVPRALQRQCVVEGARWIGDPGVQIVRSVLILTCAIALAQDGGACPAGFSRTSLVYAHRMTGPLAWRGAYNWDPSGNRPTHQDPELSKKHPDDWYLERVDAAGIWSYYGGKYFLLTGWFPSEKSDGHTQIAKDPRLHYAASIDEFNASHLVLDETDYRASVREDWEARLRAAFPSEDAGRFVAALRLGFEKDAVALTRPTFCSIYPWVRIDEDRHGFALQGSNLYREPYKKPDFDEGQYDDNVGSCFYMLGLCERAKP